MPAETKEARERRLAAERQRRWRKRQNEAGRVPVLVRLSRRCKRQLDRLARVHGTADAAVAAAIQELYNRERAAGRL